MDINIYVIINDYLLWPNVFPDTNPLISRLETNSARALANNECHESSLTDSEEL